MPNESRLRPPYVAGLVGLGQVGMLFDDDPRRSGVWTHMRAYERLPALFDLVAVADPDAARLARASGRHPSLRCYPSLDAMLSAERLDVVSLCTPPDVHAPQLVRAAGHVRAIICEKPLGSDDLASCQAGVDACAAHATTLAVNYHRRLAGVVPFARGQLHSRTFGALRFASLVYAGPLDAMGSHAVDLMCHLAGTLQLRSVTPAGGDRFSATFETAPGALVTVHAVAPREDFLFEVDLIGSEGRVRITDDGAGVQCWRYRASERFGGYRDLVPTTPADIPVAERFLPTFLEVAEVLDGVRTALTSDGASALRTQALLEQIRLQTSGSA